jgi:putative membrane protein
MFTSLTAGLATVLAAPVGAMPARMPWYDGGFSPWFLLFPLFWILVIGLLIFAGRRAWRSNRNWAATQGGESVLRERYARGEIDENEYRQRLQVLREQDRGRPAR